MIFIEVWKIYKHPYYVSNLGRVRNIKTGNYLRGAIQNNGYVLVNLRSIKEHMLLHRLVAIAFVEGMNSKRNQVNHIDGNKLNNVTSNLEWVTPKENIHHSFNNGLQPNEMKSIYCFTLEGVFIEKFDSAKEIADKYNNISYQTTVLRALKNTQIAYNLWWTYSETFDREKKIFVYSKATNELIGSYYTQKECSEDLHISTSHLSQCINGIKEHTTYKFNSKQ